jgi:GT2 family glycosyltransferase
MDVSIIIVNYNTKYFLRNCIISIYEQTAEIDFEIIVSDNGSVDGSIEMLRSEFPDVIIINNNNNLGFGAANNRGLDIVKGKYVFFLNSDTKLLNNALKIFVNYWENYPNKEELGVLGCNLVDKNMEIALSHQIFPTISNKAFEFFKLNCKLFIKTILRSLRISYIFLLNNRNKKNKKFIGEVDFICGADLFLKNDRPLRFDESFFLYYEETDLQYRLYENKKKRIIIDGPIIQHFGGSSNDVKDNFYIYSSFAVIHSFISCILYFYKRKKMRVGILKFLIILILCNPLFIKKTYRYLKKIIFL